ncbi:hypothetical protein LUZ61_018160 [Rhynchospora tenuis]|uniref:Trypsin-like serine protease n=1 Tax=Rhynchospora tenuis TaxID=198213 RepID=A0AAD6ELR0_9POAL|nr:hypothetical protein LUZ61_018160 [Rhynchospora tenuis]
MKSSTEGSSSQSSLPQKVSLKSERDVQMRRAAFHASASVVSITSYSGEEQKHHVSGTVIQSKFVDNVFKGTVLTSATLIRDDPGANTIMKDLKIRVRLWNRSLVHGSLLTFDLHYNVAIIEIQVHDELRVTNFRLLDDSYDLDDNMNLPEKKKRSFEFDVYGKPQKISAGDTVFILGRFHKQPFHTLISSGEFSLHPCYYDCKELFKINGKIKKCGIGGPVVNLRGEVLGLAHCNEYFIPFLPSNVICRLLDYYESKGQFRHPWIGMEVLNLHHSNLDGEWVEVFRGRRKSIVIEKVYACSFCFVK